MGYNVVLLGAKKSGKTSWLHRIINGNFLNQYNPTVDTVKTNIEFYTNKGIITLNIIECPDITDYCASGWWGFPKKSFGDIHAYIILFDLSSADSLAISDKQRTNLQLNPYDDCVILCGNDFGTKRVTPKDIASLMGGYRDYFYISVKENDDLLEPLVHIMRKCAHEPKLKLI